MYNPEIEKSLKHNAVVNLLDGGFFGFALGFASFVTILPLYISTMTSSALLIGLIPAIHSAGWQLPQLFTARYVARQKRYKPIVLAMTILERIPFLGLAIVAWLTPRIGVETALALSFFFLIWQGLGGGFTATAWQSMIGKIIPSHLRGTFFGAQASAGSLLASVSAVIAGFILNALPGPLDFSVCFLAAAAFMLLSWFFLAMTREPEHAPPESALQAGPYWQGMGDILRRDGNFRWFLVGRALAPLGMMGSAFYTVYAVKQYGVSEVEVGWMTGLYMAISIIANPLMGRLGERWDYRWVMEIGLSTALLSALLAWLAPAGSWYYAIFLLTGVANVAVWTVAMAMLLEFGAEADRPAYIGLANTLAAPTYILAPFLGGWLADLAGYPSAFIASAIAAAATIAVYHFLVKDPRRATAPTGHAQAPEQAAPVLPQTVDAPDGEDIAAP